LVQVHILKGKKKRERDSFFKLYVIILVMRTREIIKEMRPENNFSFENINFNCRYNLDFLFVCCRSTQLI